MKNLWNNLFLAGIGGILLYVVDFFYTLYILYADSSSILFNIIFYVYYITAAIIAMGVVGYKKVSLIQMILRLLILVTTYILVMALSGYIGVLDIFYELIGLYDYPTNNNALGILSALMVIVVILTSIVTIIYVKILQVIHKKKCKEKD